MLVLLMCRGPSIKSESASDSEFSAIRARQIHEQILPSKPHPAGSLANQLVRDRLIDTLKEIGLEVETQSFSRPMSNPTNQITLENILARFPGEPGPERPLMLVSHYDSAPQGPGAGDAGICVAAIVEIARALRHVPNLQRPVYLLITDGEEIGLCGARDFIRHDRFASSKPFVINMDSRGCAGPSLMFETQTGNYETVSAVANHLGWPRLTNSIFVMVYRMLPNGTDFTIFNRDGYRGVNFACIDGAHVYHTSDDTLANVSLRTLQHFGENGLGIAKRFATSSTDLPQTNQNAVFFDLFGAYVVSYPVSYSLPLQIAVVLLVLEANSRRGRIRGRILDILSSLLLMSLIMVVAALMGYLAGLGMRHAGIIDRNLTAQIHLVIGIDWLVTLTVFRVFTWLPLRRMSAEAIWSAVWLSWSIIGIPIAISFPEASFVCFVPGLIASLVSLARWRASTRSMITSVSTALLLLPTLHLFPIAMGANFGFLTCTLFSMALIPLLPLWGRQHPRFYACRNQLETGTL